MNIKIYSDETSRCFTVYINGKCDGGSYLSFYEVKLTYPFVDENDIIPTTL